MNRGRKIKQSLNIKDEENSPKNEAVSAATKHTKLLTPCRSVGLNRKRKNISRLSESPSEINTSSPNNSLPEIDISVKDTNEIKIEAPVLRKTPKPRKNTLGARKRTTNANNDVILSPEDIVKKYKLLYNIIRDVRVVLTSCDFDKHILNRNNVRETSADISMRIENEAISNTTLESNNSEIQTNQISTTIEDATSAENNPINGIDVTETNIQSTNKSKTSKKIKDLFGENSDDSDFESDLKRKKRKRFSLKTKTNTKLFEDTNEDSTQNSLDGTDTDILKNKTETPKRDENFDRKKKSNKPNKNNEDTNKSLKETDADILKTKTTPSKKEKLKNQIHKHSVDSQNDSDEIPEFNDSIPRKKRKRSFSHSKKSPKINKKESSTKPRLYNTDSDDDFMEKPRRDKKDPDIKKKINIPAPDPLNRVEHIRIRENKSYTIMHMNNISSYVKYYDNDVNLKRTESDDNQQTTSQPVVSNVKTSMILERKDYLNKESQEINLEPGNVISDCTENSEPADIVRDCTENSETTNGVNDNLTECSNNLEHINAVSDSIENFENNTNGIIDGFAGFTANYIENLESSNINNFSLENPDSNDIENSNSNDIENTNLNDIENPDSNDTIEKLDSNDTIENRGAVSNIEKLDSNDTFERHETVSDFEKPENVSDIENLDETQNEMKKMLKVKSNLINQIRMKRDKLDSLKRIMAYKEEHNLDDLTKTTLQFKYTLQEALIDLLSHLKTHTERNFNMLLLLGFLKIPSEMVGYNDETKSFE